MTAAPTEFTAFSHLPPELRIKIWEFVPRPRRVIGLLPPTTGWYRQYFRAVGSRASSGGEDRRTSASSRHHYHYRYIVQPKEQAIFPPLHTSREARAVWLPHFFQPSQYCHVSDNDIRFDTPFISYDTDIFTIFDGWPSGGFPHNSFLDQLIVDDAERMVDGFIALDRTKIRNLALCETPGNVETFAKAISIRKLPNLKAITILALGPDSSSQPGHLGGSSATTASVPVLEMLVVDVQRGSSNIHELPLELVHENPFLNDARLRHAVALSPTIRPLSRYKTFMLSLLWHELREEDAAHAISESWWDYAEYLFENKLEDAKCPLQLSGCGDHGHTRQELLEWEPHFEINYKLLCETQWEDYLKHIGVIKT